MEEKRRIISSIFPENIVFDGDIELSLSECCVTPYLPIKSELEIKKEPNRQKNDLTSIVQLMRAK